MHAVRPWLFATACKLITCGTQGLQVDVIAVLPRDVQWCTVLVTLLPA